MDGDLAHFGRLGIALALGLLVGLERGWSQRQRGEGERVAGIRTFGLIGLLGGTLALLATDHGPLVLVAGLLAAGAALVSGQWLSFRHEGNVGITTTIAALVVFAAGALAGLGYAEIAVAASVVTALLLGFKPEIHGAVARLDRSELLATLRLLLISVVLLPILPDRGFGPWDALNPYRIWWMVVLIAALSYAGYVAVRMVGPKAGTLVTALLGGLASSTAVTVHLARFGAERADAGRLGAAGILAATAVMMPRQFVVAAVVAPGLAPDLAPSFAAGAIVALGAAFWLLRGTAALDVGAAGAIARNPLDLRSALGFGAFLALILVVARGAHVLIGPEALRATAALAGLADVDAITLASATLFRDGTIQPGLAASAILIAAMVNTLLKPAIVAVSGSRAMVVPVLAPVLAVVAAIAAFAFVGRGLGL